MSGLGLRAKVTAAFGIGMGLLSATLAVSTYELAHHYLLDERVSEAVHQTTVDARVLQRELHYGRLPASQSLAPLVGQEGDTLALAWKGSWYWDSAARGLSTSASRPSVVPPGLAREAGTRTPVAQNLVDAGKPVVAVGVRLAAPGAEYFEVHPLTELRATLAVLEKVLLACALATTAGGIALGRWAGGRLVRPLLDITGTASAIAAGALDQRLPLARDPDLASLARSFNEMVGALEKRVKRDARFASDVSHELRSPLTTMETTVELLETWAPNLPDDGREALRLLSGEIRRFSGMVQDLLEMARFDAGAPQLYTEEIDLAEFVVHTVTAYNDGNEPVPVKVAPSAQGAWLAGDRRRLQRVLLNLLENASAYGGGAVAVAVGRRGEEFEVLVDDAGPGVPEEERRADFERFYRGSAAGRRETGTGTGLGLAIVAEHVMAHGGTAEVTERPGGGCRVVLRLPVLAADGAPSAPGPVLSGQS